MKKIYLSTYSLRVLDRKTETLLGQFDGKNDFFDFFKDFMAEIFANVKKTHGYSDNTAIHLTLDNRAEDDLTSRRVYGYISSGVGGDKFIVRTEGETATEFESDPQKHITFRNLFFYISIPFDSRHAYLVIQKKRDLGAKGSLSKALNYYLKERGYTDFYVQISNLLNGKVYDKMMFNGNLKSIDLIKRKIPNSIEDYYANGLITKKGTLTTSIRAPFSLGDEWKKFVNSIYKSEYKNHTIELNSGSEEYDEIEFELELNKKIKTFHVVSKSRTQPDIEVSSDLDFANNEPTKESFIEVSKNLIEDLLELKPNVQ